MEQYITGAELQTMREADVDEAAIMCADPNTVLPAKTHKVAGKGSIVRGRVKGHVVSGVGRRRPPMVSL